MGQRVVRTRFVDENLDPMEAEIVWSPQGMSVTYYNKKTTPPLVAKKMNFSEKEAEAFRNMLNVLLPKK